MNILGIAGYREGRAREGKRGMGRKGMRILTRSLSVIESENVSGIVYHRAHQPRAAAVEIRAGSALECHHGGWQPVVDCFSCQIN